MEKITEASSALRRLPQIQRLLELPRAASMLQSGPRDGLVSALRIALSRARADLLADPTRPVPDPDALLDHAAAIVADAALPGLRRAINATGILLHTNLGRAPLARAALDAVTEVAQGYSNLEFDLAEGARGSRTQGIEPLLVALTGAEAAIAVNNAAAAVLLGLGALAGAGEVIVSRGELVEIGGGFRIPDVIRQGGARLVEVGTTNKTRLSDYADAIGPQTRMLLKVHQSNYRIVGFTEETPVPALAGLARQHGLTLMHDLGSGALLDLARFGRPSEPTVQDAVAAGADLVVFSGDKLLGGPQAGILVGTHAAIAPLRRHPLLRALRLDKMSLAALEATLRLYLDHDTAIACIPLLRMLDQGETTLDARATRLRDLLAPTIPARIEASLGFTGGGTLPDSTIPSRALSIDAAIVPPERLRQQRPAVIGRVSHDRLLLDMLAVPDDEIPLLADAILAAIR